jgi:hypothetical protein
MLLKKTGVPRIERLSDGIAPDEQLPQPMVSPSAITSQFRRKLSSIPPTILSA